MTTPTDNASHDIVLLAGFEPFGEFVVNPSESIVRELDGESIAGCTVKGLVLPVVFGEAGDILLRTVEEVNPTVVICLGLAAERREISIERLAVNLDDARIPDNAGNQPVDKPVIADGPPACWATLPVKALVTTLKQKGIPASLSMTAGNFVCNHVFYRLMVALDGKPGVRAGFVHIPPLPAFAGDGGSMGLDVMVDMVRTAINVTLETAD